MGPFADHIRTIEMTARLLDEELARKAARRASLGYAPTPSAVRGLRRLATRLGLRRVTFQPAPEACDDCSPTIARA